MRVEMMWWRRGRCKVGRGERKKKEEEEEDEVEEVERDKKRDIKN